MLEHNQFKEYLVREIDELQETQKQLKARLADAPEGTLNLFPKKRVPQTISKSDGCVPFPKESLVQRITLKSYPCYYSMVIILG
ncbi:MAG: hypothetical protein MR729_08915 [Dorea sp.]|nr:hypothetical protein [Dorea sp.]